ncbi:MAG TPA: HAD family hydrolase [Acidimicrobiales bacterium]|nr:HAD family hydrolase [Acidimicrobiales bacterium]
MVKGKPIRLVLADVDGTLVTPAKELTDRAIAAVHRLHRAGILFAITSGRPPRGMSMLIEPLDLSTPVAAFNGGLIVNPDLSVIEQKEIDSSLVAPLLELLRSFDLDTWIYRGAEWYVLDPNGPHVDRESKTVRFAPTVVDSFDGLTTDVAKIVGVSDDPDAVTGGQAAARAKFGNRVSAASSQPYYLDVTHPEANKGYVVKFLSHRFDVPTDQIATIGDMPNDMLMFADSGLSIAMGNASSEVQAAADRVTTSNEDEGFANAVDRFILGDE